MLVTVSVGVWEWWSYFSGLPSKPVRDWTDVTELLTYDNRSTFEDTVLRGEIYRVLSATYMEPNIVLAITMLLTFPFVINFVVRLPALRRRRLRRQLPSSSTLSAVSICILCDWRLMAYSTS